ncbi:tetratricopeptide repeat protein [Actinomadura alba]|uniref:Tetratricopeptide repeat protein n=1 Tax=Actinomadura alba TaxID=406431 RepID=A0ABR7LZJ8_9ACTN|nr:tetratricopeptide repeat protein [Actinomadura alba]MBC6470282.1 tetratricopeptide repeat protein [Actinomadura alba]
MPATPEIPPQTAHLDEAIRNEPSFAGRVALIETAISPLIQAGGSLDWIFELAEIVARAEVPLEVVRRLVANLAWQARDTGQRVPTSDDRRRCSAHPHPTTALRVLTYVHVARLRYDFKFEQLGVRCAEGLQDFRDDAYIAILAALAALGRRSDRGRPLLDRAVDLPDFDSACRTACLHALWFGLDLPDQAERIMALSDEMIGRGEDGYNLYYWRSFALRRLGRLDEALQSVDRAIALLPVGMNLVHQDYVREREMIKTTQLLDEQVQRASDEISARLRAESESYLDDVKKDLSRYSESAQKIVSESLVNVVEVLGVFVALAGFLLGSGVMVFKSGGFWQHLGSIALLLAGTLLFFVVLRSVVKVRARPVGAGPRRTGLLRRRRT